MKRLWVGPRQLQVPFRFPSECAQGSMSSWPHRVTRTLVPVATGAPATPRRNSKADLSIPTCVGEARQEVEHAPGSNLDFLL